MCVIWGIPYLLIRVAVRELAPATLVFARTGLASAALLPVAAYRRELRPLLAAWRPLLVFAAVEIGVPWLLLNTAETHLESSLTALLVAATPLVAALIVMATRHEDRLGLLRLFAENARQGSTLRRVLCSIAGCVQFGRSRAGLLVSHVVSPGSCRVIPVDDTGHQTINRAEAGRRVGPDRDRGDFEGSPIDGPP